MHTQTVLTFMILIMNYLFFRGAASEQNSIDLQVDRGKVQRLFQGVKERKGPGPDVLNS